MTRCTLPLALAALFLLSAAAPAPAADKPRTRVLLITGGHGYDVKNFAKAYDGFDDLAVDVRTDKAPNAVFDDLADFKYDVIVLYNFNNKITDRQRENFLKLLDRGVGLVVWHHGLAAYPDWPEFEKIAGIKYFLKPEQRGGTTHRPSGWKHDQKMPIKVADKDHPITRGLADFDIEDETYNRQQHAPDNHVLLTTDHPDSDKPIAWTRNYGKARVFGCQLGHDAKAWANESFRKVFSQGIRWAAGK